MARARGNNGGSPANLAGPRIALVLSALALVLLGIVMVYSTSSVIELISAKPDADPNPAGKMIKQVAFAVLGVLLAVGIVRFCDISVFRGNALWFLWLIVMVLIVLTQAVGTGDEEWGARRWLDLKVFSLQISEFAKIVLVLVAARLFTDYREGTIGTGRFLGCAAVMLLVPAGCIASLQSDLGTAMICLVGIFAALYFAEFSRKWLAGTAGAIVFFGSVLMFSAEYRRARVLAVIDPWADMTGDGYQIIHSLYAIAGGGVFGRGIGGSYEKYNYLTQSETDFVFSVVGEELGLVGMLAVIALFLVILYAGLKIARCAPDNFCCVVAGGLTVMMVFQAFMNGFMVSGWFPVVGKPLPFVSSGGSSLVSSILTIAIILMVSKEAESPSIYDRRRADLRVVRAEEDTRFRVRTTGGRSSSSRGRR